MVFIIGVNLQVKIRGVMLKVAIIDADLIGRAKHRFPNLVCMKLSGYYKEQGADVELKRDTLI